ncbi:NAD(P)-dependent alcohol dehydrogenase [Microbacterium deminutum]|uniref:NAD(P)-dependent alcohol dehydrogenase n=1 Tax=Microbacterium deminutum TaxID=344164 RepID=A0ABP5BVL1_9MICO
MTTTPTPGTTANAGRHAIMPKTMLAIVQDEYGPAGDVLGLEEVPVPVPGVDEVVVRVHAASIHVGDLVAIEGDPIIARFATGLRKPKTPVPGTDVAGTVVAVGETVTRLRIGDEVFGWCTGAFAEYASGAEDHFLPKPANLTFEQAAAVGVSATTALQLLRDRAVFGAEVLINGASGGLGSYAVQIAAAFGAEVTAVCGPGNVETVRSLGADHVIDYTKEDFTLGGQRYDFILDNVANHSLARTRSVLTERGVLQSNNGTSGGRLFGTLGTVIKTAVISKFTGRQAPPSIKFTNRQDLLVLKDLIEDGRVTPLVDLTFPLPQAADALAHVRSGHARGTVVITVLEPGTRP